MSQLSAAAAAGGAQFAAVKPVVPLEKRTISECIPLNITSLVEGDLEERFHHSADREAPMDSLIIGVISEGLRRWAM